MNVTSFIAKRYLISKKSHNIINIISWVSIAVILIASAALVIVLSAMNGLNEVVTGMYDSVEPDLVITSKNNKYFKLNTQQVSTLQNVPGVSYVSHCIEDNVLLKYDNNQIIVTIKAVDSLYQKMTRLDTLIIAGSYNLRRQNGNGILIGAGIASNLELQINGIADFVTIYVPTRGKVESINPLDAFNSQQLIPTGIINVNDDFNMKYAFIDITLAQNLFDTDGAFTSVLIGCADKKQVNKIQNIIIQSLGKQYEVKNKVQLNDVVYKTLSTEKLWTYIILSFILLLATFSIISSIGMLINEKKKDIKMLYNLGASNNMIKLLFIKEGFYITSLGAIIGIIIGIIICLLQQQFHIIAFDEQFVVPYFPIQILTGDIILILITVLFCGFLSALYPIIGFTKYKTF